MVLGWSLRGKLWVEAERKGPREAHSQGLGWGRSLREEGVKKNYMVFD